ncbi:hypothetical protein [Helicobacter pylori]|uniref:hypothetical protein n=1 Tax=Helicobacter pylori TaxID=210 RepID=UPI0003469B61|nr:hypothetical protein [Helicobacter pylori]
MAIFGKDYLSTDLQNSVKDDILLIASQILKERLFTHKNEIFFCPRNATFKRLESSKKERLP